MANIIKIWKGMSYVGRDEILNALSNIELEDGGKWITVNTSAYNHCGWVDTTGIEDFVIWGKLNGRKQASPLIPSNLATKAHKSQKTNKMSMLCYTQNGVTVVKLAYYGVPIPSFPGAKFESDDSIPFWRHHALILREGDEIVIAPKPTWATEL